MLGEVVMGEGVGRADLRLDTTVVVDAVVVGDVGRVGEGSGDDDADDESVRLDREFERSN